MISNDELNLKIEHMEKELNEIKEKVKFLDTENDDLLKIINQNNLGLNLQVESISTRLGIIITVITIVGGVLIEHFVVKMLEIGG